MAPVHPRSTHPQRSAWVMLTVPNSLGLEALTTYTSLSFSRGHLSPPRNTSHAHDPWATLTPSSELVFCAASLACSLAVFVGYSTAVYAGPRLGTHPRWSRLDEGFSHHCCSLRACIELVPLVASYCQVPQTPTLAANPQPRKAEPSSLNLGRLPPVVPSAVWCYCHILKRASFNGNSEPL